MFYFEKFFLAFILISMCACSKKENTENRKGEADTLAHERIIYGVMVKGKVTDNQTRCSHYHTSLDIIAIKFKCCDTYYPCYQCHRESADHQANTWELSERGEKAILCGVCGHQLTIREYLESNNMCTSCQSSFNPNCKKHYHLYFKVDSVHSTIGS